MLGAYFGQMNQHESTKARGQRSHVGPIVVGIVLVGGVVTYAYKLASPESDPAAPSPSATVDRPYPRFDFLPPNVEKASQSLTAPVVLDEQGHGSPAAYITAPAEVKGTSGRSKRVPHWVHSTSGRENTPDGVVAAPLNTSRPLSQASADVLELGPSYESLEDSLAGSASLGPKPIPVDVPFIDDTVLETPPAELPGNQPKIIGQLPTEHLGLIEQVGGLDLSAQGGSGNSPDGMSIVPTELSGETDVAMQDPAIEGEPEVIAASTGAESAEIERESMSQSGGLLPPTPQQTTPIRSGSVATPAPQALAPFAAVKTAAEYSQFYLPTFLGGREVGSVPLRISQDKQVTVHLGSFLSLFRGSMDAQHFEHLRRSASAQEYVTLETMKAAGFNLYYDIMNKRLILGID